MISGADSFLDVHRRAGHDNLYCCLDVIHSAFHREDIPIAIEKLGDRLLVCQFCDAIPGQMTHYPPGEGSMDLGAILRTLTKISFKNFLMIEIYKGGDTPKDIADKQYAGAMETITRELG